MRSAVILAGGNGRRLGAEKSLLEFERKPLIFWTAERLSRAADEIVIVARSESHAERLKDIFLGSIPDFAPELKPRIIFTWDSVAGFGPVAGLSAGIGERIAALPSPRGVTCPF